MRGESLSDFHISTGHCARKGYCANNAVIVCFMFCLGILSELRVVDLKVTSKYPSIFSTHLIIVFLSTYPHPHLSRVLHHLLLTLCEQHQTQQQTTSIPY